VTLGRDEGEHMSTTSTDLRTTIESDGYVVVREVVPREKTEAVVADIWRHTGARPDEPESWYAEGVVRPTGMIEMYHYQSMWDTRQHERVHQVFADIFGTEQLWVSLDRANLKPPVHPDHPEYDHKGFIHWDAEIQKYPHVPFYVQGVLALADTDESMGGFQCVPEIYQDLAGYLERHPPTDGSRVPDLTGYEITKIPLGAGDMVIWTNLLPHGNGHNTSDRPRLAQYISMGPARDGAGDHRDNRVRSWQRNEAPTPGGSPFPGDPRRIEEARSEPAHLTPLGRKLIGVDPW
jgi:hypothetical protein